MGYDIAEWRDAKNLIGLQVIDIFQRKYHHKPRPLPDDEEREQD